MRHWVWVAAMVLLTLSLAACGNGESAATPSAGGGGGGEKIKIGFVIKQPDEPWFQTEWRGAQKAADEQGFELVKLGAKSGEEVLKAINNMAVAGVKGFVICTPNPKLGSSIVAEAKANNMKVMTVDDQFVDGSGAIMKDVPHLGMSPYDIGMNAAKEELKEMEKRGWTVADTAVLVSTYEELDTAKQRTDGAQKVLADAGFTPDKFFKAPNKATTVPASLAACSIVLSQHPEVKHWLLVGMNDAAVLGAVRATEEAGIAPENAIGVGINGTDCLAELSNPKQTAFVGSLLLGPNKHGYETALAMYRWVKEGKEPEKEHLIRNGILITRENFRQVRKEQEMD